MLYTNFFEFLNLWMLISLFVALRYAIIAGLIFLLTYFIFRKKLSPLKIQKSFPKNSDYRRDISYSVSTSIIFAIEILLVITVLDNYTLLQDEPGKYAWAIQPFLFGFMVFWHDTYFYWTHRLMHHPKLFKHFHLVHHKSHNPSPWASYAFHPLEAVVEGGIVFFIAFTLPVWKPIFFTFLIFQLLINIYGHTGYEFFPKKFNKSKIGKYINTSVAHNVHHKFFKGNYSLYFMFWDRWMNTVNTNYDKVYKETTEHAN